MRPGTIRTSLPTPGKVAAAKNKKSVTWLQIIMVRREKEVGHDPQNQA